MSRSLSKILILTLLLTLAIPLFSACADTSPSDLAERFWQDAFADGDGFTSHDSVTDFTAYWNREATDNPPRNIGDEDDVSFMLDNGDQSRFVNMSDGYALTLPNSNFEADLTFSGIRVQLADEHRVITVTRETDNPYDRSMVETEDDREVPVGSEHGWMTYYNEWLTRFIAHDGFIRSNRLERLRPVVQHSTDILDGFHVSKYDIAIRVRSGEVLAEMPYYNIAVIREEGEYIRFLLVVQKSTHDMTDEFDAMIQSVREFEPQGTSQSDETPIPLTRAEYWDDATARYFEKLVNQDHIDWGFFTDSMPGDGTPHWNSVQTSMRRNQADLENLLDTTFTIMPTYTHIGFHGTPAHFPLEMAREFAGGDGFNDRPVLHLSYQFTTSNNQPSQLYGYTPMFSILNGQYDEQFRRLAQDIIAYEYPVLFRLNNEMDTDWVSYCGMVTLLDPDIFVMTWERLYNIFREEGATNVIWIFNPNTPSIPYSRWGSWISYLPSFHTMHILGITAYEMGNNAGHFRSFETLYRNVYNLKAPWFGDWPWSISEFAAGSGGEMQMNFELGHHVATTPGRNEGLQADYVEDMFRILNNREAEGNEFVRPIRIAIWFNRNDYEYVDGTLSIINYLQIGSDTPMTIEEFRRGMNP
ncbi:MAG: hypothetical protein FWE06_05695 [Oscillospiraceae bacterium]|nr:hypothetical protein [Oscillospiraceae bacterium]